MSVDRSPMVIRPPTELPRLGPLVVVEGDCAYFDDGRRTTTAFSLPGVLDGADYQAAMNLGMRRSGNVVYRPLCQTCRKCQPIRVRADDFERSRSQKRVWKKNQGLFTIYCGRPTVDEEHLELYAAYQGMQHGESPQAADEKSYRRFLIETVTDTMELSWRDADGKLAAVGILDVTPDALSSVYFYWHPTYKKQSLGTFSALYEIELARAWKKSFYYLGYLVAGSKTMTYKADFSAAEIWHGDGWTEMGERGVTAPGVLKLLHDTEEQARQADADRFDCSDARPLPQQNESTEEPS